MHERFARSKKPASGRGPDAGFTMVEVVIAIMIIGGALLTIVGAAASAFGIQNMARQRQAAVAIGNEIMEQIRALPWTDVTMGIRDDETRLNKDIHLEHCKAQIYRLVSCKESDFATSGIKGTGEDVVKRKDGGKPPLVDNSDTVWRKGIAYTWHAYITQRVQTKGTLSATTPYRITVFVDWSWRGRNMTALVQSLAWSPDGCLGRSVHPVTGPCVSGKSMTATATGPIITVCQTSCDTAGTAQLSITLGRMEIRYAQEQVSEISATLTLPGGSTKTLMVDNNNDTTGTLDHGSFAAADFKITSSTSIPPSANFTASNGEVFAFKASIGGDITGAASLGFNASDCSGFSPAFEATSPAGAPCAAARIDGASIMLSAVRQSDDILFPLIRVGKESSENWKVQGLMDTPIATNVSSLKVERSANAYMGSVGRSPSVWGIFLGRALTTCAKSDKSCTVSEQVKPIHDWVSLDTAKVVQLLACDGTLGSATCPSAMTQGQWGTNNPCPKVDATSSLVATTGPSSEGCYLPAAGIETSFLSPDATSFASGAGSSTLPGLGSVVGPTYSFFYRVSSVTCVTDKGKTTCTEATVLPKVEIRIQFPAMTVVSSGTPIW